MDEIEEQFFPEEFPRCKLCDGILEVLGEWGGMKFCRCRNCGMDSWLEEDE